MRRAGLSALFALGAAVLVGALVWILRLGLGLEAAEAEARRHAAQEERARLALWRMDSALATFLAAENALPVDPPAGRSAVDPPFLGQRFELGVGGGGLPADDLPDRDRLLALLGQPPLARPPPAAPRPARSAPTPPPPAPPVEPSLAAPKAVAPEVTIASKAGLPEPAARDSIVEREAANQSQLNVAEFEQRQKVAGLQSNFVQATPQPAAAPEESPPVQPPAREAPARVPAATAPTAAAVATTEVPAAPSPPTGSPRLSRPGPRPGPPRGPTGVVRALEPVWLDGRLLLVRRVVRDGDEALQGLALEPGATREWLLGEVRDLLPAGDLEPVAPAEAADPGRRLALLPWRLEPGPPPPATAAGLSSVRLGLALAVAAILAVGAAAALALVAGLRLARRRTDFASAVIHELRTPLTTFQLYTDLLADRMVPAEEQPRYLDTLRHEAARLGHLVENVLAFARLERRRAPAAQRLVLGPALRKLAERLQDRAGAEGFTLHVEVAPEAETVEVEVDPTAVERIVHNLFDNSCRYGRGGADPRLDLTASLAGRHAVVRWRDRGPGIPRRARRRLFKPFQRGDGGGGGSGGADGAGIGLGLALSRQLARRFGGDLRCVEPDGAGAAFELTLPCR